MYRRSGAVVRCHVDDAAKNLQEARIPELSDVMKGGEARIDESFQVCTNCLTALPVRYAQVAHGILGETIEALPEGLVVDFLPHIEKPPGRFLLGKDGLHFCTP